MKNKSHQAHFVLKKKNANIVATRSLDARFTRLIHLCLYKRLFYSIERKMTFHCACLIQSE